MSDADVTRSLAKESLGATDFLTLLSPRAGDHLEAIAQRAQQLTVQQFGRTIQMFIPLYLSNHCKTVAPTVASTSPTIPRRVLSLAGDRTRGRGHRAHRHAARLILTGEDRRATPLEYLGDAVAVLKRYFASVSIEIYPLHTEEYAQLKAAGVDRMTVFQETYDPAVKACISAARSATLRGGLTRQRAAEAGLRTVNIGPLLGLAGTAPRDVLYRSACTLSRNQLPADGSGGVAAAHQRSGRRFSATQHVGDRLFVQLMTALRVFLPRARITLSTCANGRNSATDCSRSARRASRPGRAPASEATPSRSSSRRIRPCSSKSPTNAALAVAAAIVARRYQPVFKDWEAAL